MKFKKTYTFAFWSTLLLTFFATILISICLYLFYGNVNPYFLILFIGLVFVFTFVIIQYRVERFIYKRVEKIYDNVSLLDINDLKRDSITTDMETLSLKVQKFAEGKRLEIETLNERESYRREFLGNISHELKTPLFTVQGYILTLLEGGLDDMDIRDKYLERANKGVERLVSIVKDLDMIAKLESSDLNLNISTFNCVELIQDVFDLFEMKAKRKNILLRFDKNYDVPILAKGDVERIEQVLTNLVVNSIKYGKMDGTTTVSIESYNDKKIIIKVTDDGEGIRQEDMGRLFERFYRVDKSRSRDQGGSGLGLSIVKHIVEAHGESIFIESDYGKGSEFSFTLEVP
ncbi:ATP-binding protein [Aureivirga marina]|uniref:ATP-binding protein n=1 Tax=Aureivirga marina TaxID=1182451 RepID=UPI0018CB08FF|nr:ATP-binding protein [Aureivirga marina]